VPTIPRARFLALTLLLAALPSLAAPAAVLPPTRTDAELAAALREQAGAAKFRPGTFAIQVVSMVDGRVIFEQDAGRLMSPASNSKLYTGALALDRLGSDYRIRTPLFASAPPDGAGTVAGDLVVSGRGDPGWNNRRGQTRLAEVIAAFVAQVRAAGIRKVTGDVVGDATFLAMPPHGAGWTADDLQDDYGAEVSALSLQDNYGELRVEAGEAVGRPCRVTILDALTGVRIENRTRTTAAGTRSTLEVRRLPGEDVAYVLGQLPLRGEPVVTEFTVPRPAAWFAAVLKDALGKAGVAVEGRARGVRWPERTVLTPAAVKLGEVVSPPLSELVADFMKPSQNLRTDLIFAHVGEVFRAADAPAEQTSEQSAVRQLETFIRRNELLPDDVRFEEGSGLSRNNLVSARAIVALLRYMPVHRESNAFLDSLPAAGREGTLRRRLQGTLAEGNLRAKTGSLRWANSLSGYVTTAGGERLAFSLMINRVPQPAGASARDDLDRVALLLAGHGARDVPATGR
jgi:D-alanyl-D-alanine carboxypeptidase/D-alanyl-D-alanine-endopeptidase (penicillin-binding protein 4)